eukprot:2235047-Prymnesium_polylepis.1
MSPYAKPLRHSDRGSVGGTYGGVADWKVNATAQSSICTTGSSSPLSMETRRPKRSDCSKSAKSSASELS